MMGNVYLYYGTGGGKTTSALGLALRSVGHRRRVVVVQFMKWFADTGEVKVADLLRPYYEIRQFGKSGWLRIGADGGEVHEDLRTRETGKEDKEAAAEAMDYAESILWKEKPDLLILDEVCLAVHAELLKVEEVLAFLEKLPQNTDVVLTGRYSPRELIDRADFVNEVMEVKAPKGFVNERGIQY
jgi:cob(I)alamin adenosyltransferase